MRSGYGPAAGAKASGDGAFAACAVPALDLQPQALAFALEQILRLADDYDVKTGRA